MLRISATASALALAIGLGVACGGAGTPPPTPELPTHVTTAADDAAVDAVTLADASAETVSDAAPPPPPYDLAADRVRIDALAKDELGAGTSTTVAQESFVLVAAPGWSATALATSRSLTTRAIDAYFNGRFDKRPTRAVAVYLFPEARSYQAYCRAKIGGECPSEFGVYYPDRRRIVMNAGPGLGTLTHELVHPIVESDFPGAPTWIDEGIASLFEAPVIPRDGEIHGVKNWRLPRLLTGMKTASETPSARVEALFAMSNATFRDGLEKLHYATARYLCQWLDEKGWLWPFYRQWRDGVNEDPTGEKAFSKVTGMTPAQATGPFQTWVLKL